MMSPCQTRRSAETIGIGLFPRQAAAARRAVWHLQHIRHMAGGGRIQNGNLSAVFDDIEHGAAQDACVQRDGLARLQIDLQPIALLDAVDAALEPRNVIARPGDVVPAAEVQPAQSGKNSPKRASTASSVVSSASESCSQSVWKCRPLSSGSTSGSNCARVTPRRDFSPQGS